MDEIRVLVGRIFTCTVLFFFGLTTCLTAQNSPKIYKLEGSDEASKIIPFDERFQFDKFKKGTVYLITGGRSEAMLNYSYLYNEAQFLGPKNDTLLINEKDQIRYLSIGENIYYYDNDFGYVEVVSDQNGVKIGRKRGLVTLGSDKYIGYGQYVGTAASVNYKSFVSPNGQMTKLDKKTSVILTSRVSYFLIDKNNRFYPAKKSSLVKIYSKFRGEVTSYLNKNNFDYDNEADLQKAIAFCSELD